MLDRIIECVPNFSEGKSKEVIDLITNEVRLISNVKLLDVDMGFDTNRTVVTFAGDPESVIEAAFHAIKKASELIDMRVHDGAHARMGATDVCPIIPIQNVSIEECVEYSKKLAKKVGDDLKIPIFLYEHSARFDLRKNLANIRLGEYEGMEQKLKLKEWKVDYGPQTLNKKSGVTAIGVRDFLVAYNVNLNTTDRKKASDIALDIREQGRAKRDSFGKIIRDKNGKVIKVPGKFKNLKAVGWYIDEYKQAQVSMNLTNYRTTSIHKVFEEIRTGASRRGLRVTGSEIVGLVPKDAILNAGIFYLKKQKKSISIPEKDIIDIAIKSLGLDDISEFAPSKVIVENALLDRSSLISNMPLDEFVDELSRDSAAPGGGSVSALSGSLSASLVSMVINLSPFSKKNQKYGSEAQAIKDQFVKLVDLDAKAFDFVMKAFSLKKKTKDQQKKRIEKIEDAYKKATIPPLSMLEKTNDLFFIIKMIQEDINANCLSDLGVAVEMASSASSGASMNIKINLSEIKDSRFKSKVNKKMLRLIDKNDQLLFEINKKNII